jgi:uncharacterized membrane protein
MNKLTPIHTVAKVLATILILLIIVSPLIAEFLDQCSSTTQALHIQKNQNHIKYSIKKDLKAKSFINTNNSVDAENTLQYKINQNLCIQNINNEFTIFRYKYTSEEPPTYIT